MANRSKNKGSGYERELATFLASRLPIKPYRTSIGAQFGDPTLGNADLAGVPALAIEAKRVEALNFRAAMAQAIRNARPHEHPVVITRQSRVPTEDSLCVLPLKNFLTLYTAYLIHHGHITEKDIPND